MGDRKFRISYRPGEDAGVLASIYAVPGCHAEGPTREEARRRVIENLALFFEDVLPEDITEEEPH
jgi:predicted RNase H-like HicB family nuclease